MSQKLLNVRFILLNVCQSNVQFTKSVLISKGVLQADIRLRLRLLLLATLKHSAILKSHADPFGSQSLMHLEILLSAPRFPQPNLESTASFHCVIIYRYTRLPVKGVDKPTHSLLLLLSMFYINRKAIKTRK